MVFALTAIVQTYSFLLTMPPFQVLLYSVNCVVFYLHSTFLDYFCLTTKRNTYNIMLDEQFQPFPPTQFYRTLLADNSLLKIPLVTYEMMRSKFPERFEIHMLFRIFSVCSLSNHHPYTRPSFEFSRTSGRHC